MADVPAQASLRMSSSVLVGEPFDNRRKMVVDGLVHKLTSGDCDGNGEGNQINQVLHSTIRKYVTNRVRPGMVDMILAENEHIVAYFKHSIELNLYERYDIDCEVNYMPRLTRLLANFDKEFKSYLRKARDIIFMFQRLELLRQEGSIVGCYSIFYYMLDEFRTQVYSAEVPTEAMTELTELATAIEYTPVQGCGGYLGFVALSLTNGILRHSLDSERQAQQRYGGSARTLQAFLGDGSELR